jgi:DNA segregation ATPase FtsK/SpoIIIE, S-DNA-T family
MAENAVHIQVGQAGDAFAATVAAHHAGAAQAAEPIGVLPAEVTLDVVARIDEEPWRIPLGMRESDLGVAELALYEGEHALVAGPARTGKSQALLTIAASLTAGGAQVFAIAGRRSPLQELADGDPAALLAKLRTDVGPAVVLIDDAESFDDDGAIAALRPDIHVIAAGRADSLRSLYGHWTQEIRRSKVGLLLRPDIDLDGDLVGVSLPRRAPVRMTAGRGYLAHHGEPEIVQVATPLTAAKGASWTR